MAKKEGMMLTDVDALIHLLEQKKRISFSDAAKSLNSDIPTIEKWANVLQEDNIVAIKYNLTTPYMEFVETAPSAQAVEQPKISMEQVSPPDFTAQSFAQPADASDSQNITPLLQQLDSLIEQGELEQAKVIYDKLRKTYDSLPVVFLERKNHIESELIKLNNKLAVSLQKEELRKMQQGMMEIKNLLQQGQKYFKIKDVDSAADIYNKVKEIYNELPEGLYSDKTKLAEDILTYFQKLSQITNALHRTNMEQSLKKISAMVTQIEASIAQRNIDNAIDTYAELKKAYEELPQGFLDQKLNIQEKMINIYRQLMVDKRSIIQQDTSEKARTIRDLLGFAENYLKNNDIENSTKSFNEAKRIFEKMPKTFSRDYEQVQELIINHYKRLIVLKKLISEQSIKRGSTKINSMIAQAKKAHENKDFSVAYDILINAIKDYNTMPAGFDPEKLNLRKELYLLYYDTISNTDFFELGELNPYIKTRYLKLLDLLVNAHEIVDSSDFAMIDEIYNNIYAMYEELPVNIVNKDFLLKKEIMKIFEIYRLYVASVSLKKYHDNSDVRGLRFNLNFIKQNLQQSEKNCYGMAKLIKFVRSQYDKYFPVAYAKDFKTLRAAKPEELNQEIEKVSLPQHTLPFRHIRPSAESTEEKMRYFSEKLKDKVEITGLETEDEERAKIDMLYKLRKATQLRKAVDKNIKEKDFVTASIALRKLIELEPRSKEWTEKLIMIEGLREKKFKSSMAAHLVEAKKSRIHKHMQDKNFDDALQEIYTVLELDPDDLEAKQQLDKINFEKNKARI